MSDCQDNKSLSPALWEGLKNIPALRYMKEPVDEVRELYSKYKAGVEKNSFAFVHNENTFYTYHPRGWNRGEWKPISADSLSSFFEIDAELLEEGDILVYDGTSNKFIVKSGNIWNKIIDNLSSTIQINRFLNEVEEIPTDDAEPGIYLVHKDTEEEGEIIAEFRAYYLVLGGKSIKIFSSSDYYTTDTIDNKLKEKASNERVDKLEQDRDDNKGIFSTLTSLSTQYPPKDSKQGYYAFVGTTNPREKYIVEVDGGSWKPTGEMHSVADVDMSEYAKKGETDKTLAEVELEANLKNARSRDLSDWYAGNFISNAKYMTDTHKWHTEGNMSMNIVNSVYPDGDEPVGDQIVFWFGDHQGAKDIYNPLHEELPTEVDLELEIISKCDIATSFDLFVDKSKYNNVLVPIGKLKYETANELTTTKITFRLDADKTGLKRLNIKQVTDIESHLTIVSATMKVKKEESDYVTKIHEDAYSSDSSVVLTEGADLFPFITNWVDGAYIEVGKADVVHHERYRYSNYFYIEGAKEVTFRYMLSSGGAFYDKNKTLIQTYGSGLSGTVLVENKRIAVPNNAVYLCTNQREDWLDYSIILTKGSVEAEMASNKELVLRNLLKLNRESYNEQSEGNIEVIDKGTDLFPLITKWVEGFYLNSTGGQVADDRYKYSDMFYIKGAKKIKAKYMFQHGGRIRDIYGNAISYLSAGNVGTTPKEVTFDVPANGVYLEINFREDWSDYSLLLIDGQIGERTRKKLFFDNLGFTENQINEIKKAVGEKYTSVLLKDKVVSFLGDSITTYTGYNPSGYNVAYPSGDVDNVNKTWWKILLDSTGARLGINNSFSGSCIAMNNESSTRIPICDDRRLSNLGNPDYIFILAGTNDFGFKAVPIGEYNFETENQDKNNFKQALTYVCRKLQKTYPSARVIFLTLLARTDSDFYPKLQANTTPPIHYLYEYNDALKEIVDIFNMNAIDLSKCGITYTNASDYLVDFVHPNAKGMQLIAEYVMSKLNDLV